MNKSNAWLDEALTRWGRICVTRSDGAGLGYPARTIEGRLQKEGGVLPRRRGKSVILIDPQFVAIEQIMARIRYRYPQWAIIVEARYLFEYEWKTISRHAGCSERTCKEYFGKARAVIEFALAGDIELTPVCAMTSSATG